MKLCVRKHTCMYYFLIAYSSYISGKIRHLIDSNACFEFRVALRQSNTATSLLANVCFPHALLAQQLLVYQYCKLQSASNGCIAIAFQWRIMNPELSM